MPERQRRNLDPTDHGKQTMFVQTRDNLLALMEKVKKVELMRSKLFFFRFQKIAWPLSVIAAFGGGVVIGEKAFSERTVVNADETEQVYEFDNFDNIEPIDLSESNKEFDEPLFDESLNKHEHLTLLKYLVIKENGKYGEAKKIISELLEKNPNDPLLLYLKSQLLAAKGRKGGAKKHLELAIENLEGEEDWHRYLNRQRNKLAKEIGGK